MLHNEKILIAGCGDIGQRAARMLAGRGAQVWGLRRHVPAEAADGIHWIAGDLRDADTLSALPAGITRLAYLPTPGERSETAYRSIFVEGLQNLYSRLDTAALQRTVFVSSTAVYGEHEGQWVDEHSETEPLGYNGRILLEAERWLAAQPGSSVSLRLSGIYGPGRLHLIERLRAGQVAAPRHPVHWANRIHADDAAGALVHLLLLPQVAQCYVGSDDTPMPMHELYEALASMVGVPAPAEGQAPSGVGSKRMSNARLRSSGYVLRWPDARDGYAALLRDGAVQSD